MRRPNILLLVADDHAAHALSCYGSELNTPASCHSCGRSSRGSSPSSVTTSRSPRSPDVVIQPDAAATARHPA